jgi:hypothetical protein
MIHIHCYRACILIVKAARMCLLGNYINRNDITVIIILLTLFLQYQVHDVLFVESFGYIDAG